MDNLKELYAATRAYELKNGLADEPRLSTPILKERIGNNENIAGKLHVWREGEWREALGYISKDELLCLASEPTPEERAKSDLLATNAKLKAEWEKEKFAVQFYRKWDSSWQDCATGEPVWDCELLRRKPDPVYVP